MDPARHQNFDHEASFSSPQFSADPGISGHHYAKELAKDTPLPSRTKRLALEATDMLGGAHSRRDLGAISARSRRDLDTISA